jgi:hypothetical protein
MKKVFTVPFRLFVALWFIALLLPFAGHAILPVAGVLLGILVPVLWLSQMPVSCINGAFIAFPMAMIQVLSGLGWLALGTRMLSS